jgi:hypothetical protein
MHRPVVLHRNSVSPQTLVWQSPDSSKTNNNKHKEKLTSSKNEEEKIRMEKRTGTICAVFGAVTMPH